jgi:succinyl-CoA synthetase alpha subunit
MSILINKETRVIVQGITGAHGSFHTALMLEYGTKIVAGVTPGKGGRVFEAAGREIPVFNTIAEAVGNAPADYAVSFVPAPQALSATMDALDAGLNTVIITEHMPVHDVMRITKTAGEKKLTVIGPNCPGIITPGECKIGIMPGNIFKKGTIGVLSRSGTLTYEIVQHLSDNGMGQSTVIGLGGDAVVGLNFVEGLKMFESDPQTGAIVIIGEIGGDSEERAAAYVRDSVRKPVVAYVAGKTAPPGKTMGHAGAIISGTSGTFASKITALKNAGVKIAFFPWEVPGLLK